MKQSKGIVTLFLVITILCMCFIPVMATEDTGNARQPINLDGLFPSFTQEDFDSGFTGYADESVTLDLEGQFRSGQQSNAVGTVFDEELGMPISGASITISGEDTDFTVTVYTDEVGRFQVTGLEDGYYNWSVSHPDYNHSTYNGYEVCVGAGTEIFTFNLSANHDIVSNARRLEIEAEAANDMVPGPFPSEVASQRSFSSPPRLSSFTVGINGVATQVNRFTYLSYVVASEAIGYYACSGTYGMTDGQIKQYYSAQGVAANTMIEWYVNSGWKPHSNYTVCNTSHCQAYNTAQTNTYTISAIQNISYEVNMDYYFTTQFYKDSSGKYNYMYPAYFNYCTGRTKAYPSVPGDNHPYLIAVTCTDIDGTHSSYSGNGNGLCQRGAANRAKNGYSYTNILSYYYTNSTSLSCPE